MQDQEQSQPEYSMDLWEYLEFMPNLPNRQSRDELVRKAGLDPASERRVRVWDYFFRIDPAKVGVPLRTELSQLEEELAKGRESARESVAACTAAIERLTEDRRRVFENWQAESDRLDRQEQAGLSAEKEKKKTILTIVAAITGIGWLIVLGLGIDDSAGSGCLAGLLIFPVMLLTGASLWLYYSYGTMESAAKRRNAALRLELQRNAHSQQARIDQEIEGYRQESDRITEAWRLREQDLEKRIPALRRLLQDLLQQIPSPPEDEEVYAWLEEDIAKLRETALSGSGLRHRLAGIKDAENPLVIRAPAKLQSKKQRNDVPLPPVYETPNRWHFRYYNAERIANLPSGEFVDLYGVYDVAFILLGKDVFSIFRFLYDFISGIQIGEMGKEVHYLDVVSIESRKSYREVRVQEALDDEPRIQPNVPSLLLSLPSNEIIEVSFPDRDYLARDKGQDFEPGRWRSDPNVAAVNAIKNVREKVDVAKKSLQTESG